ncbi:hypothetical protein F5Y01DRAFT_97287 [Xylaria sp. FL0043]|nr:hypothetical protein F5Y01DRAFT_97287 [Xylaria sp. FL0043]
MANTALDSWRLSPPTKLLLAWCRLSNRDPINAWMGDGCPAPSRASKLRPIFRWLYYVRFYMGIILSDSIISFDVISGRTPGTFDNLMYYRSAAILAPFSGAIFLQLALKTMPGISITGGYPLTYYPKQSSSLYLSSLIIESECVFDRVS